jgi:hypothetical protein
LLPFGSAKGNKKADHQFQINPHSLLCPTPLRLIRVDFAQLVDSHRTLSLEKYNSNHSLCLRWFCVTNKAFILAVAFGKQPTNEVAWVAGKINDVVCNKSIGSMNFLLTFSFHREKVRRGWGG